MKTTPYAYCANNPTNLIDPDGEEIWALGKGTFNFGSEEVVETQRLYVWVTNGLQGYFEHLDSGIKYGDDGFSSAYLDDLTRTMNFLMSGFNGKLYIDRIVDMAEIVVIRCETDIHNRENKYVVNHGKTDRLAEKVYNNLYASVNWYSPEEAMANNVKYQKTLEKGTFRYTFEESAFSLIHELAHFYDHVMGRNMTQGWNKVSRKSNFIAESEIYATFVENVIRAEHGAYLRTRYKSMKLLKYRGKDALIDKVSLASLFYQTGDIFNTKF